MQKKHMLKLLVAVIGVAILGAVPAGADTVTLGVDRVANPNDLGGAVTAVLRCGTENYDTAVQKIQRSLVAFDLSSLPEYAEITGLTINLEQKIATWPSQNPPEGYPLSVYAVSQSSGDWAYDDSNPNNAADLWAATSHGTTALGVYTYTEYIAVDETISITLGGDLTGLVDSWKTTNAGVIITGMEDSPYVVRKFYPDTPELVVEYTPVPEPATMAMLSLGGVMMLVRRRRKTA